MLNVHYFTFNPFQENTYLLYNDKSECWIIDPGMYDPGESKQFIDYLEANKLKPLAIVNTHTHIDHIFGVQELMDKYNMPFGIHEKEIPVLNGAAGAATLFGFDFNQAPVPTFYISENKLLQLGDDNIEVRFTPGHSPGSIVFYYPEGNWVIAGDVLFAQSIGRTDLPGGDMTTLLKSISTQLFTLPNGTKVYPGHGPATTIGHERKYNPFLQ